MAKTLLFGRQVLSTAEKLKFAMQLPQTPAGQLAQLESKLAGQQVP
jgi:hypothetical protein